MPEFALDDPREPIGPRHSTALKQRHCSGIHALGSHLTSLQHARCKEGTHLSPRTCLISTVHSTLLVGGKENWEERASRHPFLMAACGRNTNPELRGGGNSGCWGKGRKRNHSAHPHTLNTHYLARRRTQVLWQSDPKGIGAFGARQE